MPDEAFDDLPVSSMQTTDQVKLFADFISCDLEIEILRHLKLSELQFAALTLLEDAADELDQKNPD